jgi:patatin-like phospholipase/acyl hydrolase
METPPLLLLALGILIISQQLRLLFWTKLSLDGGGIRGISELVILDEIMRRVQTDLKLPTLPRPADFFDLIGGTSTGGFVAL